MIEIEFDETASADFKLAALALRNAEVRPEVKIVQIDAPQNLARHALAFSCDVDAESTSAKIDLISDVLLWPSARKSVVTGSLRRRSILT